MTQTLMVQGCTSDAGKSMLVAALGRVLARKGVSVAPCKPQNMSLNSAPASNGGEIGRAQHLQAQACRVAPHTDMNPVLLKPTDDRNAQVIIHGRALTQMHAREFHDYKKIAQRATLESHARLARRHQVVLVEGAGSPAEINLRDGDIANMGFAEAVDCNVVLIADIDRGGVFAQIVGTLALLSESERARIIGVVINKFRGDITLLNPGLDAITRITGKPVLGVLPYLPALELDAEDAIDTTQQFDARVAQTLTVAVPVLAHISNHTDFDALRAHPQIDLHYVAPSCNASIPPCDLIILPGSKNVRADLAQLREHGRDAEIARHLRYGGKLLGICGGYQMLGRCINDQHGIEGKRGASDGLGLLDITTELTAHKNVREVRGTLTLDNARAHGYFIHCGRTMRNDDCAPLLHIDGDGDGDDSGDGDSESNSDSVSAGNNDNGNDGIVSGDQQIIGTYLHGIFDHPPACTALLHWAGLTNAQSIDRNATRETQLDRLADCVSAQLDCDALFAESLQNVA